MSALVDHLAELIDVTLAGRIARSAVAKVGVSVVSRTFPLCTDRGVTGVLEIRTDQEIDAESQRLVGSILRVYRKLRGAARRQRARQPHRPA